MLTVGWEQPLCNLKRRRSLGRRIGGILASLALCIVAATSRAQAPSSFDTIRFVIQTGGDDLRGDSSATADLYSVNGQHLQTVTLKAQKAGGWGNNSSHTAQAKLQQKLSENQIGRVAITLTSHNGFLETDDNWNINQVAVMLVEGNNTLPLVTVKGNPYVRLTGSAPTKSIPIPWQPVYGTLYPKYQIYALMYAVPGCTSASQAQCGANSNSQVTYGQSSSLGTEVSTSSSFTAGVTVTATEGPSGPGVTEQGSEAFGVSNTTGNSSSQTVTKTQGAVEYVVGNGDGVDHANDTFIILTNPAVNLQTLGPTQIGWSMGYSGPAANILKLTVRDLSDPAHMNAGTLALLNKLGFTAGDYREILSQDPLANGSVVDPHRYALTNQNLPYQTPDPATDCNGGVCSCLSQSINISNQVEDESIATSSTTYTVSFTTKNDIGPVFQLSTQSNFAWTNSSSQTNTQSGSQTATALIGCPSTAYKGPQNVDVYWDSLYGSFLFVPDDLTDQVLVQTGAVTDTAGKPVAGAPVTLSYNGKTYHTLTGRDGVYKFYAKNARLAQVPESGEVTAHGTTQAVQLHSPNAIKLHVPD
jgi:hypothetical protein